MGRVTIKDIAKAADVSYATVSRALSGNREIGEVTRRRILKLSAEMGYTANTVARSLVAKQTKVLGLIVSSISNPFMSEIAYHVERKAREMGYNLMLCNSASSLAQEEETYRLLMGRQVDGIILMPSGVGTYGRLKPFLAAMPTVFVSENLRDLRESYVTVDNYKGTYMGTEYLCSLGHREILYFSRRMESVTHQLRVQGYEDACLAHGLTPRYVNSHSPSSSVGEGYALAREFFLKQGAGGFSAMIASNDTMALGALQAAAEFGLSVPEDFSLLGFDNISYAALPQIMLTTVEQPKEAMATMAVDMLLAKLTNPTTGYSHCILEPSLVIRSSCRAIGDAARQQN